MGFEAEAECGGGERDLNDKISPIRGVAWRHGYVTSTSIPDHFTWLCLRVVYPHCSSHEPFSLYTELQYLVVLIQSRTGMVSFFSPNNFGSGMWATVFLSLPDRTVK
jgi:hypothetical protein